MNWENRFQKIRSKTENHYKMPHMHKKPLARNRNLVQTKKVGLE